MKYKNIFCIFLLIAVFNNCKKENSYDLFKTTGPIETRVRELSGFNRIELDDNMEVYLTQGTMFSATLEAGKNLHENIKSDITDSLLVLKNNNTLNFFRDHKKKIIFRITMPHLKSIENKGVGTINLNNQFTEDTIRAKSRTAGDIHLNVNVKFLQTSSHGDGDIYVSGFADRSYHYINGTNYLYLQNLTNNYYTFVETISIGHTYVNAPNNGILEANIWTDGNIYYTGSPASISYQRHAKGDLIKK